MDDDLRATSTANEFLTFSLGNEEYAVDILKVQEIRGYDKVTQIANSPAFIKGVINLRGSIVPIVDLRIKFGISEPIYDQFTVVIILNIAQRVVGVVVDSVSDVVSLQNDQIRSAPDFGAVLDTRYIVGLCTIEDRMIIVTDIEQLMSSEDMGLIESVAV
ncbi:chemotaxis protein CheW [Chitinivorax sp. B]|uniref:chemotaxis protein CheW n=1 Tax=Chitinivorax sp. B TaxID=2502235 RepID=UPI0010F58C64|nr:chemotaxis protein CheW [Chitinivorax sp. B]